MCLCWNDRASPWCSSWSHLREGQRRITPTPPMHTCSSWVVRSSVRVVVFSISRCCSQCAEWLLSIALLFASHCGQWKPGLYFESDWGISWSCINHDGSMDGWTALHVACDKGCSLVIVKWLYQLYLEAVFIQNGALDAETIQTDPLGTLPFHLACTSEYSFVEIIKFLYCTKRFRRVPNRD